MTKPVRYIFINRGLGMTPGKIAAQAAHAEMLAMHDLLFQHETYRQSDSWYGNQILLYTEWYESGHYTKLTMLAEDSEHLRNIKDYIEARGYRTYLVIDEGRTEISPHSPTALAVELVDKDEERVQQHFGDFRTYKEKKPPKKKKRFGRS
jgi:peptidyl-tRNA hydrolase